MGLNKRQLNEIKFHEKFYKNVDLNVNFKPILLDNYKERKPWEISWKVNELVFQYFKNKGNKNLKVLDFGCGTGISATRYRKLGFRSIYTFDISKEGIIQAKKRERKYFNKPLIKFSVQCAEELNYKDNFFDIIVGMVILHHVDLEKVSDQLSRIIKNDGVIILKEPIYSPIFDLIRQTSIVRYFFPNSESPGIYITKYEHKITKKELKILLSKFSKYKLIYYNLFNRFASRIRFLSKFQRILQKLDYILLKYFPFFKIFAGHAIIILKEPKK